MAGFDSFGGLILDRADLNALSEAAGDAKSRDFMMTVAPLPIPRGDRLLLESDSGVFDKSNVTVSGRQKKVAAVAKSCTFNYLRNLISSETPKTAF
jgi:hypothetical protein